MLNPRTFLAATAASVATGPLPAFGAAPYAFSHGTFSVTVVSDGHLVLPTSFLAPEAPPAEREPLLKAAGQTGEQYNSPTNVTLIATGDGLILCDVGPGRRFLPTGAQLVGNSKAAGPATGNSKQAIYAVSQTST